MVSGHVEQDVNPRPKRSRQAFMVETEVQVLVRLGYRQAPKAWSAAATAEVRRQPRVLIRVLFQGLFRDLS